MTKFRTARLSTILMACVCGLALATGAPASLAQEAHEHIHSAGATVANVNDSFFTNLLKTYTPRQVCMNNEPDVIWLHFVSDLLIAAAYFSIPLALVHFVRRRKDMVFDWMFVCFAVFILACGMTHVFNLIALRTPVYRLDGIVKAVTAAASIGTAIALWRLIPDALALPSPSQLRLANRQLAEENAERRTVEDQLRQMQADLEQRVAERTTALELANSVLTTEMEARQAGEVARARLAAIVESSDDAIMAKDLNGIIISWNAGAQHLFGYSEAEIIGQHITRLMPPELHPQETELLTRVRRGDHIEHFEAVRLRKDGQRVHVSIAVSPIRGADGRILGASHIARDITERKRSEAEREALLSSERIARAEAERASRTKDEFLSTLSHELRTPLTAILGWSQVLRRHRAMGDGAANEDLELGLSTIERNARMQAQLIDDLLDMSRIVAGKLRLDVQHVDLSAVVEAAIETVRPAADAKQIRIRKTLDPRATSVNGDPGRLQQVVWNLLTNAVKFTPRGGSIDVALQRINSHLEIHVKDSGIGIQPDFLPHIFERFQQADASTTRKFGGLGLGLSIARSLVEMHGGTISAQSSGPDTGALFSVHLPLGVVQAPSPERAHPKAWSETGTALGEVDLKGIKALVVDDELDTQRLVRRVLEEFGAEVETAGSARAGLEAIQRVRPDVILSDIGMPEEDGYAFLRALRSLGPEGGGNIPVAALTAFARSEDRRKILLAGFRSHIVKPVEPAELAAVVASLVGRTG